MNLSSVYLILNIKNEKIYIGSAVNQKRRFKQHKSELRLNKHDNKHLQRSYNKHGINSFIFITLEETSLENLLTREQFWIDTLKPEYNIRKFADSNLGCRWKLSETTKKKIGIATKNRIVTSEHKSNLQKALTGKQKSEEHKANISSSKKGKPWTQSRIDAQLKRKRHDKAGVP